MLDVLDALLRKSGIVLANHARQILVIRIVDAFLRALGPIQGDVEVPVIVHIVPLDGHRMMHRMHAHGHLHGDQRAQLRELVVALLHVGELIAHLGIRRGVLILPAEVVFVDITVREVDELRLDDIGTGRHVQVNLAAEVCARDATEQRIICNQLLEAHALDVIELGRIVKIAQKLLIIDTCYVIIEKMSCASVACMGRPTFAEWGGFLFIRHAPAPPPRSPRHASAGTSRTIRDESDDDADRWRA